MAKTHGNYSGKVRYISVLKKNFVIPAVCVHALHTHRFRLKDAEIVIRLNLIHDLEFNTWREIFLQCLILTIVLFNPPLGHTRKKCKGDQRLNC